MYYDIFDYLQDDEKNKLMQKTTDKQEESTEKISPFPAKTPLAMSYVPYQQWGEVYDAQESLNEGTLFPDLNFKFERGV
jgi:hypothetical protein